MRERKAAGGALLGLFSGLLLGACAGPLTSDVEPPEVSLVGLGFGRAGLFEQELRLDLRLRNPNDFDIGVDSLRFALEVNDEDFAYGRTTQELDLPALGETVVPVMVNVPTSDLLERVMALGSERRIDYRLKGEAELDNLFFRRVPFEREGKLALPRIPLLDAPE
ncbi:MAG TPA: LEA type 2 family protein [Geminicoccaceae bacterium]